MNKKKAVLFPYVTSQAFPFVRYCNALSEEFELYQVVSPQGIIPAGKDAAYLNNREEIGVSVSNEVDCEGADMLLVPELPDEYPCLEEVLQTMEQFLASGKEVRCYHPFAGEQLERLQKAGYTEAVPPAVTKPEIDIRVRRVFTPEIPVIFVGGLSGEYDQQEVLLRLSAQLREQGHRIAVFAGNDMLAMLKCHSYSPILRSNVDNGLKVLALNEMLRKVCKEEHPELILMELPGGVIRFNDVLNGGFGVDTFLLSQAVLPDYFIACAAYGTYNGAYFKEVSAYCENHFGFPINQIHVSNKLLNYSKTVERFRPFWIKMPEREVEKAIGAYQPMDTDFVVRNWTKGDYTSVILEELE